MEKATSDVTGEEHVNASNYGWKLFNCIPLVCGNATNNTRYFGKMAFFRNDVTMDKMQQQVLAYAAQRGKTAKDLCYHSYNTVMLEVPLLVLTLPIPYILCYDEVQLSGVLQ